MNKFSPSNDAEHVLKDLVRASVSGLLLSKKATIPDSVEDKIGPVRARHEGHPCLVIPLDRDPYWRYYLPEHADSVYTRALQWMRDKVAKSDFSMAIAAKVINTFKSPTDGVETQREAWKRAWNEYDRLKSELDERHHAEQMQVQSKALREKQQLSDLNIQFDEAISTCERRRDSFAAANRLAIQNLSEHGYECLFKLWEHKNSSGQQLLVSSRFAARRFQSVPWDDDRGQDTTCCGSLCLRDATQQILHTQTHEICIRWDEYS